MKNKKLETSTIQPSKRKANKSVLRKLNSIFKLVFTKPEIAVINKCISSILSHQKQQLLKILEHNKDDMTGLYDYDGIAQAVIDLVKSETIK